MTVSGTKLSQIALAGAPPALSDTLVGVSGGTADKQYTLAQVQTAIGSGGGTPSLPFNSIQFNNAGSFGGDAAFGTSSIGAIWLGSGAEVIRGTFEFIAEDGTNVTIQPLPTTTNWTLSLPLTAGTNNYVLTTDGTGITSWQPPSTASAAAPANSVQFNLVGVLGGSADFTWVSGTGLTIGGAQSLNINSVGGHNLFTGHSAFGNNTTATPGISDSTIAPQDNFFGDYSGRFPETINTFATLRHTGAGAAFRFAAVDGELTIDPASTGDITTAAGLIFFGINDSSTSTITGALFGLSAGFDHTGLGTVPLMVGADVKIQSYDNGAGNPGIITDAYGVRAKAAFYNGVGAMANIYTYYATAPDGGLANTKTYGLYVEDHSGIGATASENIHSAGASSINYFEGFTNTGGTVVGSLPTPSVYLKGMRYYVTNALAPAFGAVVAGAGAVTVPVFCDGTNWIVG